MIDDAQIVDGIHVAAARGGQGKIVRDRHRNNSDRVSGIRFHALRDKGARFRCLRRHRRPKCLRRFFRDLCFRLRGFLRHRVRGFLRRIGFSVLGLFHFIEIQDGILHAADSADSDAEVQLVILRLPVSVLPFVIGVNIDAIAAGRAGFHCPMLFAVVCLRIRHGIIVKFVHEHGFSAVRAGGGDPVLFAVQCFR